jgi:prolyl-tRNA synthetase
VAGDSGERKFVEQLPRRSEDYSRWYLDVIAKAELADYSPVRGCMVIRPYGYTIWENMQALLDARFKATGHTNAYFPLFVPESLLMREAEHVEGFAPEVAWVTHAGGEELEERLAIRPTSEAIIGTMYHDWVQSWRDLPVLINQWCNVVRWEKRTLPFLRTAEFLWQEGHTAHRTSEEAEEETQRMLEVYRDFIETELAIPVIPGQKTESEKFPGAQATYTVEALMPDGRALQSGTSHFFGQNFAEAFDISFQDLDGERRHAWTTSWGLSTRTVGALIMVHGDDSGLIVPPRIAPIHVVIVPIPAKTEEDERAVREAVERIEATLKPHYRFKTDWSDKTPGWKFNEWELRGVPIRIEVGPRDVKNGVATLVRRDNRSKQAVPESDLLDTISETLEDIQRSLFARALAFREENTHTVESMDQFVQIMQGSRGFLRARWCGKPDCEDAIKEQTGATIRCLPRGEVEDLGACVYCGAPSERRALFARAY